MGGRVSVDNVVSVFGIEGERVSVCVFVCNHLTGSICSPLQAFGVFGLCQIHAFIDYLRSKLSQSHFDLLFRTLAVTVAVAAITVGGTLTFLESIHNIGK